MAIVAEPGRTIFACMDAAPLCGLVQSRPPCQAVAVGSPALVLLGTMVWGAPDAASEPGRAEPDASPIRWYAEAATDVPIYVGARTELEIPHRLLLWTSLGVLPGPYIELIDDAAQAFGGYDDATSALVTSSLESSLVWRLHAGWRPFPREGFSVTVGYTLATLGGSTTGGEILQAALDLDAPPSGGAQYDIQSTLHLVGVELGWRIRLWKAVHGRLALGFVGTVGTNTQVDTDGSRGSQRLAPELAAYLDGIYTQYVHTPYIGLSLGPRLDPLF